MPNYWDASLMGGAADGFGQGLADVGAAMYKTALAEDMEKKRQDNAAAIEQKKVNYRQTIVNPDGTYSTGLYDNTGRLIGTTAADPSTVASIQQSKATLDKYTMDMANTKADRAALQKYADSLHVPLPLAESAVNNEYALGQIKARNSGDIAVANIRNAGSLADVREKGEQDRKTIDAQSSGNQLYANPQYQINYLVDQARAQALRSGVTVGDTQTMWNAAKAWGKANNKTAEEVADYYMNALSGAAKQTKNKIPLMGRQNPNTQGLFDDGNDNNDGSGN